MNFLTAKSLSRRTVLRGIGASLALPFLDAMVPSARAATKPVRRFLTFYPAFMPAGITFTPAHPDHFLPEHRKAAETRLKFLPTSRSTS